MALKPLNSVAGFSVGETPANIILANGDITTNNLSTTGKANLNAIGNVIISGGSSGQVIQTDGLGNLSFVTINTSQLANGNSNVQVYANSNVAISVGGTSNIATFTSTGMNVAGYITGANITATGNISVNNYLVTPTATDLIVAPDTQLTRFYSNVNPFSGGYSLGNSLARWDNVFANTANIDGNVSAGNVLTNNLLYANGQPWDLQEAAGANKEIQYNDGSNNFGASANFTFDYATNLLTVNGNAQFNNANLGNLATANYINVSTEINGNVANFSGNVTGLNANLGNLVEANYVNVSQQINGNVANFSGNLTAANANLGNLATANFVNVSSNINVTNTMQAGNVRTDNLLYANGNPWDLQEAAGANTQIQYNDGSNNFGASANFTFNDTTNVLTVNGNANVTNTLLTPNINSGTGNLTLTSNGFSTVYDNTGNVSFPAGGTVTAGTFVGNVQANITITAANTTVLFSNAGLVDGSTGFTFDNTSNAVTANGNLTVNNANLGNLAIANYANFANDLVVQGNIANANNINVTNNITSNTANVIGNLTSGNANLGNLAIANNFSTNGSGGDITLTGGNVVGANVVIANSFTSNGGTIDFATNNPNVKLGNVGNVHIGGGSNGQILQTDGAGNLSWSSSPNISIIQNGNSNVNIPSANGNVNTSVGGNANIFVVTGTGANVNGTFDVSSNLTANNANFANDLVVQGNIANANNISVTHNLAGNTANFSGNVTSLNANLGNLVTANYINVASNTVTSNLSVNLELSGNTANFSGNVIVPNLTVNLQLNGNTANFTGNVIAANIVGALANGTSNVKVYQDANIEFTINGVANVATIASTGVYVVGEINTTSGNVLSNGNVTANSFLNSANANVTGEAQLGSVKTANITATTGNITISASGVDQNIILNPTGNGTVDVGSHRITQIADPTQPHDAATKEYVDNIAQGLSIHPPVRVTSTTNLNATYNDGGTALTTTTISGGKTITFSANHGLTVGDEIYWTNSFNGIIGSDAYFIYSTPALNQITVKAGFFGAEVTTLTNATGLTQAALGNPGVGATLTNAGANAAISIDSIALSSTNRVLVQGQTNQVENGVYDVSTVGNGSTAWVLTRSTNEDQYDPKSTTGLAYGDYFFVEEGTNAAGSSYVLTSPVGEILFGITNIGFSQFSASGSYSAGNGIAITGTIISANVDLVTTDIVGGNIVVKASANLTTPNIGDATFSSLTWNNLSNGNVTANNLSIGNIANITGNLRVDGIIESNGNVTSNAYINGNNASFSNFANIGGNLLANNITSNNDFSTNTANISTNLVTSNATVNLEFSGNTANFSGNVILPNLTVNLELAGNTANFSGNVVVPNLTVNLELSGNTANFTGNVAAGNFSTAGNISGANVIFANSFTSNGGTIDFATNNPNVNLGNVGNVHITGGSNGQILQTDGTGNLSWSSAPNISIIQNGTSNVTIPTANGNVTTNVNGNTVLNVTDIGANLTGYANISGNIFAPAIIQNASTYDTRIELSSSTGIIQANTNGNVTQFLPGGSMRLPSAGASDIVGGTFDGSKLVLGASQTDLVQNRGGNVTVQTGTSGTTANTWTFAQDGNLYTPGQINTSTVNANTSVLIGNSTVTFGNVTTSSVTANQTIASFNLTGANVTGVEYLVKAVDAGGRYSVATVLAVTDGTAADYVIYGTTQLGGYTGSLAVNISGGYVRLQVTPASSNSTVWTTQYRLI